MSITTTRTVLADVDERTAVHALMTEPEATVSGAPVYAPEAALILLAALLLSPKQPRK
ncbi:hypothetical protein GCM10010232_43560 [Streptomyces amakusaensis]|uniref:Uncharacterized protein n=2 Tax=Streptomyces TaxID=1883 RepID=A0A918URF5_9ACTN|nr:hypothetical protein [Streptomyces inusitatus]GGZ29170.1 hypothetical protein GCM10010387_23110 [Streptomyces inusitatus]